jgi:hypothetical protein
MKGKVWKKRSSRGIGKKKERIWKYGHTKIKGEERDQKFE